MNNRYPIQVITLLTCCVVFYPALALDNYPFGARSAGMSNASVTFSDVWSIHHNQAGIANLKKISAGVSYQNNFLLKEVSTRAGVIAIPTRAGSIGLCFRNYGFAKYSENKYLISFAKNLGERFSLGIALDYLQLKIAEGYGSKGVLTGEIGLQAIPLKNLRIGVHVFNPMRTQLLDYNKERIPTLFRFGGSYTFSEKVLLALETEKDLSMQGSITAGIEYCPVKTIFLRLGISTNPGCSSYGIGVQLKNFKLDCSTEIHPLLGIKPQMALTYVFNK